MTVHEFFEKMGKPLPSNNPIWQTLEIWSNNAAKGYALIAMQKAGLDQEQIKQVLSEMRWEFDQTSVDEAARVFETSPY